MKMLIFALAVALPCAAQIPDAPKPQAYFANTLNRSLAIGDIAGHFLDAISTYQFEHDPCGCVHEIGTFYGTFSLAPISKSMAANFGYQLGLGAANIAVSRELWMAGRKRHSWFLKFASRAVLAYDIGVETRAPINNWRLIATGGKKGF
jgi:hypothetical protein